MRAILAAAGLFLAGSSVAVAADPAKPPDHFTLTLTPQQAASILTSVQELPFKVAQPLLAELSGQLQAQMPRPPAAPPSAAKAPSPEVLKGK